MQTLRIAAGKVPDGETADHIVVFKDALQQVGECAHQAVAPAGFRTLLVGGRSYADVDCLLGAATMLDFNFPDAGILGLEEADSCDEVRVLDLLHPFRESGSCVVCS